MDAMKQYATVEYLVILQPHADLYNKIMEIKQSFAKAYECDMAMYLKPHLTLVKFTQYEIMEQRIMQRIQNIVAANAAFKVDLKGFGSFPSHTIYINIETKNQVNELSKSLKQAQHLMKMDKENKPHFITEPHISIARKLLPWQYEKGWLEYSNTPFTASFMATEVIVLKKREGYKGYTVARKFPLLNQAVATTIQTALFA